MPTNFASKGKVFWLLKYKSKFPGIANLIHTTWNLSLPFTRQISSQFFIAGRRANKFSRWKICFRGWSLCYDSVAFANMYIWLHTCGLCNWKFADNDDWRILNVNQSSRTCFPFDMIILFSLLLISSRLPGIVDQGPELWTSVLKIKGWSRSTFLNLANNRIPFFPL